MVWPATLSPMSAGRNVVAPTVALLSQRETSRGLDDVVVRGPVLVGRAGAEALRLAVHEPRPRRREVGVGEAEAPERPGTKVRHEHVAGVEDAQERSQPIRMLHVERHGALVAVDVERDPRHLGMRPAAHEPVRVAVGPSRP